MSFRSIVDNLSQKSTVQQQETPTLGMLPPMDQTLGSVTSYGNTSQKSALTEFSNQTKTDDLTSLKSAGENLKQQLTT